MDSLRRGYGFFIQSWQMAFKDKDLLKPSVYALIAGIIVTLIFSIPMIAAFAVFGDEGPGRAVGYFFAALLIFVQYAVSYIFSAMTIYLIYGYLSEGDGKMERAWAIVQRDWLDILSLAGASTLVNLLRSFIRGKGKSSARNALASLIDTVWTEATYLVLPAMVIDDMNLKEGLRRATQIVKENLLLVGVSTVGVKAVTGLIGFLMGGSGIALGVGVSLGIIQLSGQATWGFIGGISFGVILAALFIMVSVVITSYTATAYHTCLYIWARDVERARQTGASVSSVEAPKPLAAVLT